MPQARSSSPSEHEERHLRYGAVRVLKGRHAGKIGYYDDDDDRAVVYFGEPIHSGYTVISKREVQSTSTGDRPRTSPVSRSTFMRKPLIEVRTPSIFEPPRAASTR
jgi:hypothetical protein